MNVVQLRPPRKRVGSQYEKYPTLEFFNAAAHSTWNVQATGDYVADCATGRRYAIEFLRSYDGTVGWVSLLGQITADMIRAGTSETWGNGQPKVNGVVIGFMGVISRAVAFFCMITPMPDIVTLMEEH
jgi:hypothetical protein